MFMPRQRSSSNLWVDYIGTLVVKSASLIVSGLPRGFQLKSEPITITFLGDSVFRHFKTNYHADYTSTGVLIVWSWFGWEETKWCRFDWWPSRAAADCPKWSQVYLDREIEVKRVGVFDVGWEGAHHDVGVGFDEVIIPEVFKESVAY